MGDAIENAESKTVTPLTDAEIWQLSKSCGDGLEAYFATKANFQLAELSLLWSKISVLVTAWLAQVAATLWVLSKLITTGGGLSWTGRSFAVAALGVTVFAAIRLYFVTKPARMSDTHSGTDICRHVIQDRSEVPKLDVGSGGDIGEICPPDTSKSTSSAEECRRYLVLRNWIHVADDLQKTNQARKEGFDWLFKWFGISTLLWLVSTVLWLLTSIVATTIKAT
jgi:hypothetical protein